MGILKKIRDKTGTVHDLGDSRVDAFETELSGAKNNVPYSPAVLGKANAIEKKIDDHVANTANPHGVTKEQLGLANVENKSSTQIRSEITKENVTNALGYTPIDESRIGAANGVASLDAGGRIPASQIPGGFDNIDEYDSLADFPETGEEGKIYVAKDTNLTYRWTGTQYIEISPSLALGETATTAYRGDRGKTAYDHSQVSGDSTIHHTHANKELLDSYKQTEADLANAVAKVHEHGNKAVLDGITADTVGKWDAKMDKQTVGSESVPVYLENGIAKEATGVATKAELEAKQDKLTAGDLITIANNVVSAANVLKPTDISNDPNKDFDNLPADNVLYYKKSSTDFANQPERGAYRFIQWTSSDYYSIQIAIDGNNQFFARSSYRKTPSDTFKTWRPWIKLQEKLTFDETPTAGSTNPVTSGGIKAAIDAEATARADADTALGGRIDTVDAKGLTVKEIDGEQVLCFE
nr:MAG TPA: Peptidase [Caudoviricetes sp.]